MDCTSYMGFAITIAIGCIDEYVRAGHVLKRFENLAIGENVRSVLRLGRAFPIADCCWSSAVCTGIIISRIRWRTRYIRV
jgi:hypothetical protein